MHARRVRTALIRFGLADAREYGPGDAVPDSGLLVVGEVGGGIGAAAVLAAAWAWQALAAWPTIPAAAPRNARQQDQRRGDCDCDLDGASVRVPARRGPAGRQVHGRS